MSARIDLKDALFGAFLIAVAGLVFYATRSLSFGAPSDMGAGFMPRVLAAAALAFGLFFLARGMMRPGEEPIEPMRIRPLACLLAGIAAFALLGLKAGIGVAAFATVVITAFGSAETRPIEIALYGAALAAASALLFVKALSLPMPIWPW